MGKLIYIAFKFFVPPPRPLKRQTNKYPLQPHLLSNCILPFKDIYTHIFKKGKANGLQFHLHFNKISLNIHFQASKH